MKNITENIERYASAWNETTPEAIKAAFEECCVPGVTYTDKNTPKINSIDQLTDLAMQSHRLFPGRTFSILTEPEYFDGLVYYTWGINLPGKGEFAGHDFMEYNDNGLIARIVGFLPLI